MSKEGIQELLDSGETVQKSLNPSRFDTKYFKNYIAAFVLFLLIAGLAVAKTVFQVEFIRLNILALGLIGPLLLILHAEIRRKFIEYHFTDREIIEEKGILNKNYINIPYSRIQDVSLDTDFEERIFDVGDLDIRTAGTNTSEQILNGLKDPESYKVMIARRSTGNQSQGRIKDEFEEMQDESGSGNAVEQNVLKHELERVENELDELDQKISTQGLTTSEKQEWYELDGQRKLLQRLVEKPSEDQNF